MSAPRHGLAVLARGDPRLLRATLQSVERLERPPELIAAVAPRARAHLLADLPPEIVRVTAEGHESPLSAGLRTLAAQSDVAIWVPEGVVLAETYLAAVRDEAERWEDLVGALDLVTQVTKAESERGLADAKPEFPGVPLLRGWLRARSLMAGVLWARVAACGHIDFPPSPESCDTLAFALYLEALRPRGRTTLRLAARARQVRFLPERRSGFDLGHELYGRLERLAEVGMADGRTRYVQPRREQLRLIGEPALRYALAPGRNRDALTVLQGALAARREARATRRAVQRDLREIR